MAKRSTTAGGAGAEKPGGAACGCAAGRGRVGPGGLAEGVDAALKASNLKHLRRIEGQIRGLAAMIEDDRYCADIINQVSAVRESLHAVARNLMRNHLKHCAAAALREEGPSRDQMIDEVLALVGKVSR